MRITILLVLVSFIAIASAIPAPGPAPFPRPLPSPQNVKREAPEVEEDLKDGEKDLAGAESAYYPGYYGWGGYPSYYSSVYHGSPYYNYAYRPYSYWW